MKPKKIKICEKCGGIITKGHNCKSAEGLGTYNDRVWTGKQYENSKFTTIKTANSITYIGSGQQLDGRVFIKENIVQEIDKQIQALTEYKSKILNCGSPSI